MTNDELLTIISVSESFLKEKEQLLLAKNISALRAVMEWTNNLQDTESWQDDAEYNAGYNNAIYEVIEIIKNELK